MSDWIEWNGGECPVEKGTIIDVKYRDGDVETGAALECALAERLFWVNDNSSADIIAYRLHQEAAPLAARLRTATVRRDKQAARAARHADKLQHREAEVERLKSELERKIEAETGLACTIGGRVGGIPDGVDVDDLRTWKIGDFVVCTKSASPAYRLGCEYVVAGLKGGLKMEAKLCGWTSVADSKFRFVRRPA